MKKYYILLFALTLLSCSSDGINDENVIEPEDEPSQVLTTQLNGHEYVDLGLSSGTKWATQNVGAEMPSDYGWYFSWGECTQKLSYIEEYYFDWKYVTLTRNNRNIAGTQFDAALINWGKGWSMPTRVQCQELISECTWKKDVFNSVDGYTVTGKNGKSIFLPFSGTMTKKLLLDKIHGYLWTEEGANVNNAAAVALAFNEDGTQYFSIPYKYEGNAIRPVCE